MSVYNRLLTYSKEQLEPISRLLLSFLTLFFIELTISVSISSKPQFINIIIPALSIFFLLVYYRVSDEFKDYETDKKFFPDRPIPSGRLFLSDLKWLLIIFAVAGLVLNLIWNFALTAFIVALLFTLAMGKWFFLEKILSTNRLLAFITHAPVGYFLYYYGIKYISEQHDLVITIPMYLSFTTYIAVPGFVWEILRKTYVSKDEIQGYQTYSMMLGFRGSLLFAALWVLLIALNNYFLSSNFIILEPTLVALTGLNFIMVFLIILQALNPWTKNLKKVAEGYMAMHLLIPMSYLLWVLYGK